MSIYASALLGKKIAMEALGKEYCIYSNEPIPPHVQQWNFQGTYLA